MCGICAFIGYENGYKYVYFGLMMLQNRGYDSAGICGINKIGKYITKKYASLPNQTAVDMLANLDNVFDGCENCLCHTRWSTHGAKTIENSHPHFDHKNKIALVHNGIIENFDELKEELINQYGIAFVTQTDTEVIVNLISIYYDKLKNMEFAIKSALDRLEGTWGLAILNLDEPNKLYCARHGSPLLIGFGDNYAMVASEQSGFCKFVNNYICLNDQDVVVLEKIDGKIQFHKKNNYQLRNITVKIDAHTPEPYAHWTLKEIYEQPESAIRAMGNGGRILNDTMVKLGGLSEYGSQLRNIDNLILVGCGTSYFAGLHSLNIFKEISGFNTVQIFDGSEFSIYDIPKKGNTALLILSQSGETKDLYEPIKIGKQNDLLMIGVINVVDSLIAREVHCGVYLNSGKEIGVASTKAFTSQVIVLYIIALWFAQIRKININKRRSIISDLRRLSFNIKDTLDMIKNECTDVAKYLLNHESMFVLGKNKCSSIAQEGALKIKEIGYIHAESYSSSALKHGPYSIIREGLPIIIINLNNEFHKKNKGIIEELKARGAHVIEITDKKSTNSKADIIINIKHNDVFGGLLSSIPMQLIAYKLSCLKGNCPDLPRNLAKSITVD